MSSGRTSATCSRKRARGGCCVRVLLGDADAPAIAECGREEKYGRGIESWCRVALVYYRPLMGLAGGAMEMTDSLSGAAVREVKEETGYDIEITGLVGTCTDPRHIIAYSDGEVRWQFNVCFLARLAGGELKVGDESLEVRWVPPHEVDELPMHHTQRFRLTSYLEGRDTPYLG